MQQPGESVALRQLGRYGEENACTEELVARWEALAVGKQEARYRVLIGKYLAYNSLPEQARPQLQKAVAVAPEDAAAWLALGEFEMAQGTLEAGPALEKARALGIADGDPGTAIESLAADHLAHGRAAQALDALEQGWVQVKAPATRLRIISKWADLAYSQHALNGVREKLEGALNQGDDRGAELAQFYLAAGDYAQASTILVPALKAHPDDANLRTQELIVARTAGRTSEVARLLREEVRLAPTPAKWRDLFVVLVENGETEPARELINAHGDVLAATAATWHTLIPRLWQLQLTPDIAKMLAPHTEWEATLTRAEAFIADGLREKAEPLLWALFDSKWEADPLSSFAREMPGSAVTPSALPGAGLATRYYDLSYLGPNSESVFTPLRWFRSNVVRKWQTIYEARGWAAFYLAVIAADAGQEPAFVSRLKEATASWPIAERVLIWSVVENSESMLREIETAVALNPPNSLLNQFCRLRLEAFNRSPSVTPAFLERVRVALAAINSGAAVPDRSTSKTDNSSILRGDGGLREASGAFMSGDYRKAASAFHEAMEKRRKEPGPMLPVSIVSQYQAWMLPQLSSLRARPDKLADASVAILQFLYETMLREPSLRNVSSLDLPRDFQANRYYIPSLGGVPPLFPQQLEPEVQKKLLPPPPRLFNNVESAMLWAVFGLTREPRIWTVLKPRLDTSFDEASPATRKLSRIGAAYLLWWHGDSEAAVERMRTQLKEEDDDDVRMGLAAMLRKLGRPAEAKTVLDSMPAPYPAFERTIDGWRLLLAAEAKDSASVKALMVKLKNVPVELPALRIVATALDSAGYKEEAMMFYQRISEESSTGEDRDQLAQALTDATKATNSAATRALTRTILEESPLQAYRFGTRGADLRNQAVGALRESGESQAYVATLEKAANTEDNQGELAVRKAEVSDNADEFVAAWRKVLEKQPANREALKKILLKTSEGGPARRAAFEAFLAVGPEEAFTTHGESMVQTYQRDNELARLVEKLESAPFPKKSIWWKSSPSDFPWSNLANRLSQQRQPELAVRVLRRATQVLDPVPPFLRQSLVRELMLSNRKEEAGQALLQALAPDPGAEPLLFALHQSRVPQYPGADADFDNLKLVQELGVLPALQARLEQTPSSDVHTQQMLMWVRLLAHDTAALPEMDAYLKGAGKNLLTDEARLKKLIESIGTWKEATSLTKTLLAAFDQASTRQVGLSRARVRLEMAKIVAEQGDQAYLSKTVRDAVQLARSSTLSDQAVKVFRQAGEAAASARNDELFGICVQTLAEKIAENSSITFNIEDAFYLQSLASKAGRTKESAQLAAALRQYATKHSSTNLRDRVRLIEIQEEWDKGEFRLSQPIVWFDVQHSTTTETSLVWDVGAVISSNSGGRQLVGHASTASPADHRYTVELFAGSSESTMESLLRRPEANVHGAWRGALPPGTEFVRVVFSDGDRLFLGDPMRISLGTNLFSSEKTDQWLVPANSVKTSQGGPIPGGQYLSYRPESGDARNSQNNVNLGRVKIQPGKNYIVSGWLRAASDRQVYLTWQYLNDQNAQINTGSLSGGYGVGDAWAFGSMYLHSAYDQQSGGVRLPEGVAAIEFSVGGGTGGFDAAGISLIEVPESKPSP